MNYTLVVIDDNEMILTLLKNCFAANYNVHSFTRATQALASIQQGLEPDLIVTDLNMPGLDGLTFLRKIKSNTPTASIPVIVLSGSEKSETRIACLEAGADDFLPKPFHPEELRVRIHNLLSRHAALHRSQILRPVANQSPDKQFWAKRFLKGVLSVTSF